MCPMALAFGGAGTGGSGRVDETGFPLFPICNCRQLFPSLTLSTPEVCIMKKSTSVLILLLTIELLLAGGAAFMVWQVRSGAWSTADPAEALSRILAVALAAAPLVAVPFLLIYFGARRRGL